MRGFAFRKKVPVTVIDDKKAREYALARFRRLTLGDEDSAPTSPPSACSGSCPGRRRAEDSPRRPRGAGGRLLRSGDQVVLPPRRHAEGDDRASDGARDDARARRPAVRHRRPPREGRSTTTMRRSRCRRSVEGSATMAAAVYVAKRRGGGAAGRRSRSGDAGAGRAHGAVERDAGGLEAPAARPVRPGHDVPRAWSSPVLRSGFPKARRRCGVGAPAAIVGADPAPREVLGPVATRRSASAFVSRVRRSARQGLDARRLGRARRAHAWEASSARRPPDAADDRRPAPSRGRTPPLRVGGAIGSRCGRSGDRGGRSAATVWDTADRRGRVRRGPSARPRRLLPSGGPGAQGRHRRRRGAASGASARCALLVQPVKRPLAAPLEDARGRRNGCGVRAPGALAAWPAIRGSTRFIRYVTTPVGQVFLRLLFMLVIPLLVSALALGVTGSGRHPPARPRSDVKTPRLHDLGLGDRGAPGRRPGQPPSARHPG